MSIDSVSRRYYSENACRIIGSHTFVIWAEDTSGNWNSSSGQYACVDTTPPSVTDLRAVANPAEVFSWTNLSAIVADNYRLTGVWLEVIAPDLTLMNLTMVPGPRYSREISPDQLGTYTFRVLATDAGGLLGLAQSQFIVRDTTPPSVFGLTATPNPVTLLSRTNLTATVTDNFRLVAVRVEVTAPDATSVNLSMSGGPTFYRLHTATQFGSYTFKVSAVDSSGNWASFSNSFTTVEFVPPVVEHDPETHWPAGVALNIPANITDNVAVQGARLNYTDVDGVVRNVTMSHGAQDSYSYVLTPQPHAGTISYFIWAIDSSGNTARSLTYRVPIIEMQPCPPTNLTVTPDGFGALRLRWIPPTTNMDGSPLTDLVGYNVYRRNESGGQWTKMNTGLIENTTHLDIGLEDARTYYYAVTSVNSRGIESSLIEVSGTTLERTSGGADSFLFPVIIVIVIVLVAILLFSLMRRKKHDGNKAGEVTRKIPPPPPDK